MMTLAARVLNRPPRPRRPALAPERTGQAGHRPRPHPLPHRPGALLIALVGGRTPDDLTPRPGDDEARTLVPVEQLNRTLLGSPAAISRRLKSQP